MWNQSTTIRVASPTPFYPLSFAQGCHNSLRTVHAWSACVRRGGQLAALNALSPLILLQNVAVEFVPLAVSEHGKRLPAGNFTGLLGALERREVDAVTESFLVTVDRLNAFAFSNPLNVYHEAALMRKVHASFFTDLNWSILTADVQWYLVVSFFTVLALITLLFLLIRSKSDEPFDWWAYYLCWTPLCTDRVQ